MGCLDCTNALRRSIIAAGQVRRTLAGVMSVAGQEVHEAFIEHALRPVTRLASEAARQGSGRDLHEHATGRERLDQVVLAIDPCQTLWVGQDRNVSRDEDREEQVVHPLRGDVVGRFNQHVARVPEGQKVAARDALHEVGHNVIVGPWHKPEGDAGFIDRGLEFGHRQSDCWSGVVVDAGQNVRRAGDDLNALLDELASHVQGRVEILSPIIDAGQDMAMEIEHEPARTRCI